MAFLTDRTLIVLVAGIVAVILNLILPLDSEGDVAAGGGDEVAHVEREDLEEQKESRDSASK
jgi:hypothetical protein